MPDYEVYVGVDWATQHHQVSVVDPTGQRREERQVPHSGSGLAELVDALTHLVSDPQRIAVAIEVPRGAIVDTLLERGCHVFALNPKQLDRFRDRHTVAGAKDDRRDAFVLADALRTDRHAFRRLNVEAPVVIQLREMSRLHGDLVEETSRLTNRLREQLWRIFPPNPPHSPAAKKPRVWGVLPPAPAPAPARRRAPRAPGGPACRPRAPPLSAPPLPTRPAGP